MDNLGYIQIIYKYAYNIDFLVFFLRAYINGLWFENLLLKLFWPNKSNYTTTTTRNLFFSHPVRYIKYYLFSSTTKVVFILLPLKISHGNSVHVVMS